MIDLMIFLKPPGRVDRVAVDLTEWYSLPFAKSVFVKPLIPDWMSQGSFQEPGLNFILYETPMSYIHWQGEL